MDWQAIGTIAVGLFGVFGGAGWLAGRHTRRLARLKNEAELVNLLEPGTAQARLREHLEANVVEYVEDQKQISPAWLVVYLVAWVVSGVALVAFGVVAVLEDDHEPASVWSLVLIPFLLIGVGTMARITWHEQGYSRRFRQLGRRQAE